MTTHYTIDLCSGSFRTTDAEVAQFHSEMGDRVTAVTVGDGA